MGSTLTHFAYNWDKRLAKSYSQATFITKLAVEETGER